MGKESLARLPKSFTQEDLIRVIEESARRAAQETANAIEERNRKNARLSDPGRAAQRMLADYRRLKLAQREDIEITEAEGLEMRWRYLEDLMGTPDHTMMTEEVAYARERKLQFNQYKIRAIESAVALFARECEHSGSEEALRRNRIIQMRYMNEDPQSVEEIAAKECVSKNTVYNDLNTACRVIAAYLSAI